MVGNPLSRGQAPFLYAAALLQPLPISSDRHFLIRKITISGILCVSRSDLTNFPRQPDLPQQEAPMFPIQKEKISSRFKLFHELMLVKVQSILLIGTSYEAWIMEEDCRISEQIVNEYRGLNLSRPPRLTWVSSLAEALEHYPDLPFDLAITFSRAVDEVAFKLGREIKKAKPEIPVVLLTHQEALPESITGLA